jgi:hypothetical protein
VNVKFVTDTLDFANIPLDCRAMQARQTESLLIQTMDSSPEMRDSDFERSASASDKTTIEVPPEGQIAPADRSKRLTLHVTARIRIISDALQWVVQTRRGRASAKSSGWRSRHFCRSRKGLQLALRRLLGRDGVPADVVGLISALPEWHRP